MALFPAPYLERDSLRYKTKTHKVRAERSLPGLSRGGLEAIQLADSLLLPLGVLSL